MTSDNLTVGDGGRGDLEAVMEVMDDSFDPRFGEAWTAAQCAGLLPMQGVVVRPRTCTDAKAFGAGEKTAKQVRTRGWTPWHWLHFLRSLPADLTAEQMAQLDAAFALTESGNAEILGEWLELAARCRYEPAYERLESFLIEVGRRKFLTPIYRALASSEEGREQATKIYAKARPGYHAISRGTIDGILRVK